MTTHDIENYLEKQYTFEKPKIAKFPNEVKSYIVNYVEKIDSNLIKNMKDLEKCKIGFYLLKHGLKKIQNCNYDGCTNKKEFISISKGFKYGCCRNHTTKLSLLEKYGVENISHLNETKNKISNKNKALAECAKIKRKNTNLEKYGVDNTFNCEDFRDKVIATNLEKYGVEHHTQSKEFQEKERLRYYSKTGYYHSSENPEVVDKISRSNKIIGKEIASKAKETVIERYGVDNISQLDDVKLKKYNSYLEHYGVGHPMHSEKIFEKNIKARFKIKEYIWKTGEISKVQGYENIVLKELEEKGYSFDEVKTLQKDIPTIWYNFKGNKKRYYPDIFIPSENLIIEVKSTYTYEANLEINLAKQDAVLGQGFNFRFEIR